MTIDEIKEHGYNLNPGRYVGLEEVEEDDEYFNEKIQRLVVDLKEQFIEAQRLDKAIWSNLKEIGHES